MPEANEPPRRKSMLGWCVLVGTGAGTLLGALVQSFDLNIVSGAIYGFLLGVLIGVLADRS